MGSHFEDVTLVCNNVEQVELFTKTTPDFQVFSDQKGYWLENVKVHLKLTGANVENTATRSAALLNYANRDWQNAVRAANGLFNDLSKLSKPMPKEALETAIRSAVIREADRRCNDQESLYGGESPCMRLNVYDVEIGE